MPLPNPAMFADDAIVIYNVLKDKNKKKKDEQKTKQASIVDIIKAHPKATTSLALSAGGLATSMYGSENYFGPAEGEAKFDPKRAAKSVLLWNAVGRSVLAVPNEAAQASEAIKAHQYGKAVESVAMMGPGIGAIAATGVALADGQSPERQQLQKGLLIGAIPTLPYGVRDGYRLSKAIDKLLGI